MEKEKYTNKNNTIYIDILKIIACFLVIVNHTDSEIFLYTNVKSLWFSSIITFFVCKMAVPIFILISGALLIKKEYEYKIILKKVLKYGIILLLISFSYYIYNNIRNNLELNIKDFIINLCNDKITIHLWYIYFYISLLLMCPFLHKMVKAMSNKDFKIYIFLSLIINGGLFILIPHYYPEINLSNYLFIFHPYIGLFLTGYYIENRLKIANKKTAIKITSLIVIFFSLLNAYLTNLERINNPNFYLFFDNISLVTITIPSIALYILIKLIIGTINKKTSLIIKTISNATFGIYLIHMIVINNNNVLKIYYILQNHLPIQISMYIWELIIFTISLTIVLIYHMIICIIKNKFSNRENFNVKDKTTKNSFQIKK